MVDVSYPLLRFVDSPDASATTRLDFHAHNCWTNSEEWQIVPGEFLGEPGGVGGDTGFSQIGFTWYIKAESRVDALAQQSALARELQRDENYLLFQLSSTDAPLWFRCHRSSVGAMSLRYVRPDRNERDVWLLDVSLVADSHALGAQESFSLTITNDPATGGLSATLPEIRGDAPAPLVVDLDAGATTYMQPFLSVAPLDADWPGVVFSQAESWTLGTDVSASASGSASGGSWASWAVLVPAVRQPIVSTQFTVPFAGRWRLFARVEPVRGGGAPDFTVWAAGAARVGTDGGTQMTTAGVRMLDMGVYAFPKGNMPSSRPYTIGTGEVAIEASNELTATVNLRVDYVVAIPADLPLDQMGAASTLNFDGLTQTLGTVVVRLDGEHESVEQLTSGTTHDAGGAEQPVGAWPTATPGATNVLHLLTRRSSGPPADSITSSQVLDVTYRPRFVYLAGS